MTPSNYSHKKFFQPNVEMPVDDMAFDDNFGKPSKNIPVVPMQNMNVPMTPDPNKFGGYIES